MPEKDKKTWKDMNRSMAVNHGLTKNWKVMSRNMMLNHELSRFTRAFRDNFLTLIISALGLVVALSWNNFWVAWVNTLVTQNTLPYKFAIAMSMTLLAVVLTYLFSRFKSSGN